MKFTMKDFFSKCDQIRSFLRFWSHLLKKSLMENFIFCTVTDIKENLSKVYKGIGLLRNLSNKLRRQALVTIYNAFVRPHLDYSDTVYEKPNNKTFINKTEEAQYDAPLAITGAIRVTSREKLYAEIGIESLKFRRWFRKLVCFYKNQFTGLPKYLLQLIPINNHSYILRKPLHIPHYYCRTDTFKNSFFSNVINEWNKLDDKIKGATSFSLLKAKNGSSSCKLYI